MFDINEVETVDRRIQRSGSGMLFAKPVLAAGRAAGVGDALTFYAGGRGGVLCTSSWEQVQSSFAFFPADVVRAAWESVNKWGSPRDMSEHYANGLAAFGADVFPEQAGQTFATLGRKVAKSVTPLGYPLFVGWRAVDQPDSGRQAAALVMMTLRELRGDIHIQDIAAFGVGPIEAEVVVRGEKGVQLHGWSPPYPDPEDHRAAVEAATRQTTERMRRIYEAALSESDWRSFSESVAELSSALREFEA